MKNVKLKEMEGSAVVRRIERKLRYEVKLFLGRNLRLNLFLDLLREEEVVSVKDGASKDDTTLVNSCNVTHL